MLILAFERQTQTVELANRRVDVTLAVDVRALERATVDIVQRRWTVERAVHPASRHDAVAKRQRTAASQQQLKQLNKQQHIVDSNNKNAPSMLHTINKVTRKRCLLINQRASTVWIANKTAHSEAK